MGHFNKMGLTMTRAWKLTYSFGLLLVGGALLSGCAIGPSNPPTQIAKQVEAARTPADHEELAKYYLGQATTSRVHADKYRKLAKSVQGNPTGGRGSSNPKVRYNSIINMYESEAAGYDTLAEQQRLLAKTAQS